MAKNKTSLAAILATQGSFQFYIVAMPSEVLRYTCFTVNREEDPMEGFQRRLDENRATEIAAYIDTGVGSIPTAIILSAQTEAKLAYSSRNKTISFEQNKRSFLIIDGQHRVYGFIKASNSIRVPVVIYEGLNRIEEARLFIDINTTQKQVPDTLLLDVKRLLQDESAEEKRCSDLFEKFFIDSGSILKGFLDRTERTAGKISRIIFNNAMVGLLDLNFMHDLPTEKVYSAIIVTSVHLIRYLLRWTRH
jgi:DGQHR domain-containing protein